MRRNPPGAVVFFGTSISSAYLSGATTLFRALAHAFLRLGARVTFVEEGHAWLDIYTDYTPKDPRLSVRRYTGRTELTGLLGDAELLDGADLILKFSGSSLAHDRFLDEWLVAYGKLAGGTLIYVDADAPMRLPYIIRHHNFYLRRILPAFDGVWVMLGGGRAAKEYLSIGASVAWALPPAIDHEHFSSADHETGHRSTRIDLLFVGNPALGRERAVREYFGEVASACPDLRFALAGAEWERGSFPINVHQLGYIHSDELPVLYRSARLTLNVTREEMAAYGDAATLRLFEAAACGACVVSDVWSGVERLFVPGKELLIARGTSDVVAWLRMIGESEARAIGRRARRRVLREHTADVRVAEFLAGLTRS